MGPSTCPHWAVYVIGSALPDTCVISQPGRVPPSCREMEHLGFPVQRSVGRRSSSQIPRSEGTGSAPGTSWKL
jgi:hypothetical protein